MWWLLGFGRGKGLYIEGGLEGSGVEGSYP